jgi:hypothetical protein
LVTRGADPSPLQAIVAARVTSPNEAAYLFIMHLTGGEYKQRSGHP